MGKVSTYLGGGYVFNMNGNYSTVLNQTCLLKEFNWIDQQTRAVFIEFTLFNPNANLFQSCLILFEILNSGSLVSSIRFKTVDLYDLTNVGLISFKILTSLIYLAFVGFFMLLELKKLKQKGAKYFSEFYNYIDLLIIIFSWSAFSVYLYRLYSANQIKGQLKLEKFVNLQYIVDKEEILNIFIGFCAALATLRFIKLFRFNKKIIVFLEAFKKSLTELTTFSAIFIFIFMSFVQIIYIILNSKSEAFSSLYNSALTCFQIILGKFDTNIFFKSDSYTLPCWLFVYNIFVVYILVNIFVSILIEYYHLARIDEELERNDPELFSYLKNIAMGFFCFKSENNRDTTLIYLDYWDSLPGQFDIILQRIQKVILI